MLNWLSKEKLTDLVNKNTECVNYDEYRSVLLRGALEVGGIEAEQACHKMLNQEGTSCKEVIQYLESIDPSALSVIQRLQASAGLKKSQA